MRRRVLACSLAFILLLSATRAGAISTSAGSSILVDGDSGRVFYAQKEKERRPIASITKLMTALVVAERMADLDELVTVNAEAALTEGSSMYLALGEKVSVKELLYGLLLSSGNDAAVCLAIYCAGDTERFASWMNVCAAELGMVDTHFANPNGLDSKTHYSTAYDMSLLARACMRNERVAEIVSTKNITLGKRTLVNHNKLLWRYDGCIGMKTGYTDLAGRTLISCAERNGQKLIAVTLSDPNDWKDHAALLDYGFATYPRFQLARSGKIAYQVKVAGSLIPTVLVATAQDVVYPLLASERVTAKITLPRQVNAPISQGETLGKMEFFVEGVPIGTTDLVAIRGICNDAAPARLRLASLLDLLRK